MDGKDSQVSASICTNTHLDEMLKQLSPIQRHFVVAKASTTTDVDACKEIGLSISTMRHWPVPIREVIRQAESLIALDVMDAAVKLRRQAVVKAVMVQIDGLESPNEKIRQRCASEILNWELGKASAVRVDVETGENFKDLMERIAVASEKAAGLWEGENEGEDDT
jgi:hypothetical protein